MRTFSAVGVSVTACAHHHSYWRGKSFIVIQFGRVPARIHQETAHSADFFCAAAPPHQRHRVLLALLTPPSCLKTDIDLVARALITIHSQFRACLGPLSCATCWRNRYDIRGACQHCADQVYLVGGLRVHGCVNLIHMIVTFDQYGWVQCMNDETIR